MLKFSRYSLLSKLNLFKLTTREYCGSDDCEKSAFENIKTLTPQGISRLTNLFQEDKNENKVNLGIGVYRTEENKPYILPVVKKCALELVQDPNLNFEYLPVFGNPEFTKAASELILGKDCKAIEENRIVGVQTISGSGALRLAVEFISQHLKKRTCYMSDPTWKNHSLILKHAGIKTLKGYPYWNDAKRNIDISNLLAALNEATEGDVILLQPSAHNPTGMDPTKRQWKQIAQVIKERNLFPFFDVAYQGFASGDPDRDTWAVRYFVKKGMETLIAQSFSKNMGLYMLEPVPFLFELP
ncbi:aspartate aminotransferase, cytoplasmic-like isoform X2 [Drosophila montana]|uniref:aspartate aminotransferase, cytoplasmic-like isoform X2 n=1 Tax=Drosophila montana TaxID=40370 RepID=UPI00313EE700